MFSFVFCLCCCFVPFLCLCVFLFPAFLFFFLCAGNSLGGGAVVFAVLLCFSSSLFVLFRVLFCVFVFSVGRREQAGLFVCVVVRFFYSLKLLCFFAPFTGTSNRDDCFHSFPVVLFSVFCPFSVLGRARQRSQPSLSLPHYLFYCVICSVCKILYFCFFLICSVSLLFSLL